ncbi:MAG TPA: hypothetical protein VFM01_17500 [Nakamurella sp.]|nr:hypothetical protein [Nakamurella sp.]
MTVDERALHSAAGPRPAAAPGRGPQTAGWSIVRTAGGEPDAGDGGSVDRTAGPADVRAGSAELDVGSAANGARSLKLDVASTGGEGASSPAVPATAAEVEAGSADQSAEAEDPDADRTAPIGNRGRWGLILTVLAGALVWLALALPGDLDRLGVAGLLRVPLEALVLVLLALLLPRRALRVVAAAAGVLIGLLVLLKLLDVGFDIAFARPFDVVNDWYYLGPAVELVDGSAGRLWAVLAVIGAVLLVLAVLIVLPLAAVRVTGALARRRRRVMPVLAALTVCWVALALVGVGVGPGARVASADTSRLVWGTVGQVRADLADRGSFAEQIGRDRFALTPDNRLLTGLRGKDVLLVFVESYGRVALDDPALAPTVDAALSAGDQDLRAAGFSARSAYLDSPTFGGSSWLAHSSIQSGLWVDSQQRYDQLVSTNRLTLARAFKQAGWRTVFDVPSTTRPWPEGQPFYGFDMLYTADNVGYQGPRYGYATMPDQFILNTFRQRELTPGPRRPVMAEIDLLSSHYPWTVPPELLPWDSVGDGSIFRGPAGTSPDPAAGQPDDERLRYGLAIAYSLRTLASFAATSNDPNLVILAMGDHQPNSSVTGPDAGHQVPAMLITRDPGVLDRVSGWGWTTGLNPGPAAPVWRMDQVRDRILTTFGPTT